MTEEHFAYQIRQQLNQGLNELPPATLRRLEAARHYSVDRLTRSVEQPVLSLAGQGMRNLPAHRFFRFSSARPLLATLALLLGMAIAMAWQNQRLITDLEDIDSAVLTDALPPEAFLDNDFAAWLSDSSEE